MKRIVLGVVIFGLLIIIINYFPTYNNYSFDPPNGVYQNEKWGKVTYSTMYYGSSINFPLDGTFTVRREAYIKYPSNINWENVMQYFQTRLVEDGWNEVKPYGRCKYYFQEAKFLLEGENGYSSFSKGSYDDDSSSLNHLICIGIYEGESKSSYTIIFQTVELSLYSRLWAWISHLQ